MASEIHKKRTGKGFRISEEIVVKEEMYEEEEDDFPRSYRLLGPHMRTESPEMNTKVEAFLHNRMTMSKLVASTNDEWRENEIHKLFAQSFPNAGRQAQQMSQQLTNPSYPGQMSPNNLIPQSPVSPTTFTPVNYQQNSRAVTAARPSFSPLEQRRPDLLAASPLVNSPANPKTPELAMDNGMAAASSMVSNQQSAFSADLPTDTTLFVGDAGFQESSGQGFDDLTWGGPMYYDETEPGDSEMKAYQTAPMFPSQQYHGGDENAQLNLEQFDPTSMEEPSWETFLNDSAWATDQ